MNKGDFINKIANDYKVSKTEAARSLDMVVNSVQKSLSKGEEIRITGFGSFYVSKRAKTKGRNPQTGKEITIKAKKVPKFRAGKSLKDSVN